MLKKFDFGENWLKFAEENASEETLKDAEKGFNKLIDSDIKGKRFLDIGFGQGLPFLVSLKKGADSVGIDINPKCKDALKVIGRKVLPGFDKKKYNVVVGSILSDKTINSIKEVSSGSFDIVYSWGVLHHTGKMYDAIDIASDFVNSDNGLLILALYNKHWTSPIWKIIKIVYNASPKLIKFLMIKFFGFIFTLFGFGKKNKKARGMDFHYDVIDWVGGYPYEYASKKEIVDYLESKGYKLTKFFKPRAVTGCNEFVFKKINV